MMSDKFRQHHLERRAILYVRHNGSPYTGGETRALSRDIGRVPD